ncbi:uncharacterized protein PODANS_1_20630 [Podospora anserina S mat+]|uniref:Ami1 nuclear positioning protein encoded by the ami1 protein n=1 Tax=Podospora anserina (strain S / ATCC MYA-4624 / DSM 980 / FGSC 10383) TaxID=515849 RepID=B2ABG9_PODAN|nr:uncharacterized protein PODANS_1_20630 [Podospora anserina S mat+]CAP60791.1 unnamed protein product [Podospora anserina S mat+]CDP24455.1 Ami1 nuclear positioning protein encoded by the ami1 gene [Podospora anserina S mat+]
MATSVASDKPVEALGPGEVADPFVISPSGPTHLRHSNFDGHLLALAPGASAEQTKRAIQAHLRDTERRMEEAGKLGTALVQQQKELTEKLREVERLQSEAELDPDLRQRLLDIEKDYSEVARDSARALLPKQRVPSSESQGSPYAAEGKAGRRSVSPSKFETLATPSPTKFSVPNRKLRNQPASRIHDIEFAAEISTSLIAQVRNLQALLSEREEELKESKADRARLELEAEGFQQHIKSLDESESRYKDENWNLETQIHELMASQKEAAEREKKLTQALAALQSEKNATQRELEEVKDSLAKQEEKHSAAIRNLEIELGTSRRSAVSFESERLTLQKRVDELTSQNQELAKAFSAQRGRMLERESTRGVSDEDRNSGSDRNTGPEQSPPPSPLKMTPRHSGLETETLKTSLGHAQRTIQTLRTNIHREKTEKLELKRMLQDARDEVEKLRSDPHPAPKKNRKLDAREAKKPNFKVTQLGGHRPSRIEVVEDPDWDDVSEAPSPRTNPFRGSSSRIPNLNIGTIQESSSDHFETAHEGGFDTATEASEAFETAHERGTETTETEDFETGLENITTDESEDTATETESGPRPARGAESIRRPPPLPASQDSYSFDSTASTSSDEEYGYVDVRSPSANPAQRMRARMNRGSMSQRQRQLSEDPSTAQSSPLGAPVHRGSITATPQQSLFAELNNMDNSDEDSYGGTPARSLRSMTPATPASVIRGHLSPAPDVPRMPIKRVTMVDSGMMTEPVDVRDLVESGVLSDGEGSISAPPSVIHIERSRPRTMESVITRQRSMESVIGPKRSMESVVRPKRSMQSVIGPHTSVESVIGPRKSSQWLGSELNQGRPASVMSYSDVSVQHDSDVEDRLAQFPSPSTSPRQRALLPTPVVVPPQTLSLSSIQSEDIAPVIEPELLPTPPSLSLSAILTQHTEPVREPEMPPPKLTLAPVLSQNVEPVAPVPPVLSVPATASLDIEPVSEPEVVPAPLSLSAVLGEQIEPIAEPEPTPAVLSLSSVHAFHDVEPVPEPEPVPAPLSFSAVLSTAVEPIAEVVPTPAALSISSVHAYHDFEPIEAPEPEPVPLSMSTICAEEVEPTAPPSPILLSFASIVAEDVEPVEQPFDLPAPAVVPVVAAHSVETKLEAPASPPLSFSSIKSEAVEPRQEPEPAAPAFGLAPIQSQDVEPREVPLPALSISTLKTWDVEPQEPPAPALSLSSVQACAVEPVEAVRPPLSLSAVAALDVEPRETPLPVLSLSSVRQTLDVEPREEPVVPPPALSLASIQSQAVEPLEAPEVPAPLLSISAIGSQVVVDPVEPEEPKSILPPLTISAIQSLQTEPSEGRSPKRNAFIIPRGTDGEEQDAQASEEQPAQKQPVLTADQGVQTTLTSEAIDQLLLANSQQSLPPHDLERSSSHLSMGTPSTVRINRARQGSFDSTLRSKGKAATDIVTEPIDAVLLRRPGSSASIRSSAEDIVPPLPANHKEAIEAARTNSSGGGQETINSMPPPLFPASAMRPRTPTHRRPLSPAGAAGNGGRATPTPRAHKNGSIREMPEVHSPSRMTARSRKSSISSFASEVDTRFNIHPEGGYDTSGLGPNTDPRMIQAITQTMIGEYLWKYTRKAGRGEMSENRHRRYFWVHPYTRTLYWSDRDPSSAGRHELRAKSVPIEAVRVVADDNPMPPGLHRKSLVIVSPGRTIKFTCTTGQRHETWFNALSYLLLRTSNDGQSDAEEMAGHITSADVDEFNPSYGKRMPHGTRGAPSLSSYNSRTVRESPTMDHYLNVPTLTPSRSKISQQQQQQQQPPQAARSSGTLSRISGYWKDSKVLGGTFGSLRSRSVSGRDTAQSMYESSEVQDSAEDLRQIIEQQDREADRLENVRACCDGKHDVGTLTSSSKRGRNSRQGFHSHTGPSSTPTPVGTVRSRA